MAHNPLDRIVFGMKAFAGFLVLSYLMSVVLGIYFLSADSFQRLGSAWIAILLFAFGFSKLALQQIGDAIAGVGEQSAEATEKLSSVMYSDDKGWLNFMSRDGNEYERPLYTREEIKKLFAEMESRSILYLGSNELLIAFFATLQWGYGDLLRCWLNKTGCITC